MTGSAPVRLGLLLIGLTGVSACVGADDGEPAASAATTGTPSAAAASWNEIERILSARQGEYTVHETGVAADGRDVVLRDETTRFDLDAPFVEETIRGVADPITVIYTDAASFMRSDQWTTACGTPWIDLTAAHLQRSDAERAALLQPLPALLVVAALGEPQLVGIEAGASIYEVTLPAAFGLPPFPEHPQVRAILGEGERTATVTVPGDDGAAEIELLIDLSEVDDQLGGVEPDSTLTMRWTVAAEFEPVDTTLPDDAAHPACAEPAE